jgi:hypothetical protein
MNLEKHNAAMIRAEADRLGMRIGNLCDIPTEQELLAEEAATSENPCGWCGIPLGTADFYGFCPKCVVEIKRIVRQNNWNQEQARFFIKTLKQNPLVV